MWRVWVCAAVGMVRVQGCMYTVAVRCVSIFPTLSPPSCDIGSIIDVPPPLQLLYKRKFYADNADSAIPMSLTAQ